MRSTVSRRNLLDDFPLAREQVVMDECFRPGDVVRSRVLSMGTMREYFLTTAKPDLGVASALSAAGRPLIPVNWETMRCPESGNVEKRKVAKLDQPPCS